jgi:hypothetical protein
VCGAESWRGGRCSGKLTQHAAIMLRTDRRERSLNLEFRETGRSGPGAEFGGDDDQLRARARAINGNGKLRLETWRLGNLETEEAQRRQMQRLCGSEPLHRLQVSARCSGFRGQAFGGLFHRRVKPCLRQTPNAASYATSHPPRPAPQHIILQPPNLPAPSV